MEREITVHSLEEMCDLMCGGVEINYEIYYDEDCDEDGETEKINKE